MEEKINLIKAIVRHHPSLGVTKGWSDYTGGFKDSGSWKWEKMIDAPDWELREFHKFLKEKEIKDIQEREKLKTKLIGMSADECRQYYSSEHKKQQDEINNLVHELECRAFFGITRKK